MSELLEIIIEAIDNASETFQSIVDSADSATASLEDMNSSAESTDSTSIQETADATHEVEEGASGAGGELENINNLLTGFVGAEVFTQMADTLWDLADKAGNVQDSISRMSLAAEGAGVPIGEMKSAVSSLGDETGRTGGQIRESFITMTSAGITNMDAMTQLFKGASAQSFILGTDVDALANKFSGMAMKSSIAEKTLKGTGVTIDELGRVLGMEGASIDEINAKWETMDVNARAAALGQAAAMNEGEEANEAYKNSWQGLQAQIDKAKSKLEVLAGNILLPVLVPALEVAGRVLSWLGDTISAITSGPAGGLISVIGSLAAGIALAVPAIAAIQAGIALFTATIWPAVAASWALIAPWLPFIAIGAAVVLIIYEIGKAFGWWTDASSMIDHIGAGLQRLWDAFINHPDVQAAISAISGALSTLWSWIQQAGQAVLDFFGISQSGGFDIVAGLINAIGAAWNFVRTPLVAVITGVQQVIGAFNLFRSGQMDLPAFIYSVMSAVFNMYVTVFNAIMGRVIRWGAQMLARGIASARAFVNGIINWIRQLPGRVYSGLIAVVSRIRSGIQAWVSAASTKVSSVIKAITSPFSGVATAISGALSGVVNAIKAPFDAAWKAVKPIVDKIQGAMKLVGAAGGETAAGGEIASDVNGRNFNIGTGQYIVDGSSNSLVIEDNINLTLDLRNVPSHIDSGTLIEALSDKNVLNALVSNRDFQSIDAQVKQRLNLKQGRSGR